MFQCWALFQSMSLYETLMRRLRAAIGFNVPEKETVASAGSQLLLAAAQGDITGVVSLLEADCCVNAYDAQVWPATYSTGGTSTTVK